MTRSGRSASLLLGLAATVFVLDRLSKIWVEHSLAGRPPIVLIARVLDLRFTTNSGGAFSLGQSTPWLFIVASVTVSLAIIVTAFRHSNTATSVALGLILGGALGNLTDRVVRGPHLTGRVVDFIDLHVWPIFNLADSAIVVGAVALFVSSIVFDRNHAQASDAG